MQVEQETARTLVIGDVHGKLTLLNRLLETANYEAGKDRLVFIGDLIDRGEDSRGVVARALELKQQSPDLVVVLRGNHEDMMMDALSAEGQAAAEKSELWYFNGGIETLQSYMKDEQLELPPEHLEFLSSLPTWYEDEHAIYVHAGLVEDNGKFLHPSETPGNPELMWTRNRHFFAEYKGKLVVFGHTINGYIFGEPEKAWLRDSLIGIDTGAYLTGVLSAIELPSRQVFSVRAELSAEEVEEWEWARKKLFTRERKTERSTITS